MIFLPLARAITLATAGSLLLAVPSLASADFIQDSKASLSLRNLYMNQDTRHDLSTDANKTNDEWSQGIILQYESGFTEGTIGLGLDVYAATGIKLDSGPNRTPDSFPTRSNGKSVDDFGKLGGTAKARISKTILQVGTLMPRLPVVQSNLEGRLLPQIFTGGLLTSQEIKGLTARLGHIDSVNQRSSTNHERMQMNVLGKGLRDKKANTALNGKNNKNYTSNSFDLANLNYKWNDSLATGYTFGRLEDLYKQHVIDVIHVVPLGDKRSLKTDLRFSRSSNDGQFNVDNKSFSGMTTYSFGFNKLGLSYQKMTGNTGFAYINGADPFLVNYVTNRDFAAKDEMSWQVRHDYNFAGWGIPGLTVFNRFVKGTGADLGADRNEGREWERDLDITYAFQEGALKNFSVRWRNATVRSNIFKDLDDNRIILSYKLALL